MIAFTDDERLIAFSPKPEDLRFYSEAEGVRYATAAGFTVMQEHGRPIAIRMDMPKKEFQLIQDKDKPERFVWMEV